MPSGNVPQFIGGPTPSVEARFFQTTAQSGLAQSSVTTINFDTLSIDSAGAVTTGASWVYTAPLPGVYFVDATVVFLPGSAPAAGTSAYLKLVKNGTPITGQQLFNIIFGITQTSAVNVMLQGDDIIALNAGDTIAVQLTNTTGVTVATITLLSFINIFKVG